MIAVIGCGNPNRRDDGAGPAVIAALKARGLENDDVKLFDAGTDGMAVMFGARGCAALIIVDAAQAAGAEPGAVYEVPGAELERPYAPGLNLHDFRWDTALHAGRQIFREAFPQDVTVFLIQADDLSLGVGLSDAVDAALEKVADRIEARIKARSGAQLELKRGGLYLSRALCAQHFDGLASIILLRRGDDLVIAPVRNAASGGYLLKQRNGAGDRVVDAPDFFREHGVGDAARSLTGNWDDTQAAFVVRNAFAN